jgi:hypothetical protein
MSEFELKMYLTQNALYGQVNGIEDAGWLEYELQNKTFELTKMKEEYYMKKIILDSTVNKYNLYSPANFVSKFETPTYDQIDIVDLLI